LADLKDCSLLKAEEVKKNDAELELLADKEKNSRKTMALIVVNYDNEKDLYTGLINQEKNFDFGIDVVSLREKKVGLGVKKIKEFL
jgi:hypothetical protein